MSGKVERAARGSAGGKARRAAEARPSGEALAREAWALLFQAVYGRMRHFPALAAEFELSPVQAHMLRALGEASLPMSAVASLLGCDASNVTGLVDRLEARGLVERQNAPHDRRVKMLVLTPAGEKVRAGLLARILEPPASIAELSPEDLRALREVLRRALGQDAAADHG